MDLAEYSFDLDGAALDALRTHLLAAQSHHLDRARELRMMRTADQLATAVRDAEQRAAEARRLWALLAGVRVCRCEGVSPLGHVEAGQLLAFLDGGEMKPARSTVSSGPGRPGA